MKVREFLTEENWVQGNGGAIAIKRCYGEARFAVHDRFRAETGENFPHLWNDDPARTFAEVKALCEKLDI